MINKLALKIILICFLLVPLVSSAIDASTVQQQISDTNKQIEALDKEIAKYQAEIDKTSSESDSLKSLIKQLNLTKDKLVKESTQTSTKIKKTGLVINSLNNEIENKQQSIEKSKVVLKSMLSNLYKNDDSTLAEKLLSSWNLSDASKEYNNTLSLNEDIRKRILEINTEKQALDNTKNTKEGEQNNLKKLKESLSKKQQAVELTKKEKDALLKETKNKESNYKKLLAEQKKKRDAFEKDLENYESQLKFILNPKLLPSENSGVLSWPLDNVFITQLFGKTVAAKRLYTSGSHSGVDFRASVGTEVKSMANGTVIGTGDTDMYCKGASFGKWVFIKYDNGLSSTYGHLSLISAQAGQRVATGDVVGLSGNTGHSTGPHLHVTVYASSGADVKTVPSLSCSGKTFIMPIASSKAYLDPMLYLPSINSKQIKNDTSKD